MKKRKSEQKIRNIEKVIKDSKDTLSDYYFWNKSWADETWQEEELRKIAVKIARAADV